MAAITVDVPEALLPFFDQDTGKLISSRFKAAWGGRGGTKSHFFAEQLILRCYDRETRAVCIREVQTTIKDSVRQLLIDKIKKLNLDNFFQVLEGEIRGANGSYIIFKGMQSYNAHNIKSLEDFDVAWVEEAQTFSKLSLRLLRPTIRKRGSELWFSWNPRHDDDAVDEFFRGDNPPPDAIIVNVNWFDNPWFFDGEMPAEKDLDYTSDPEMAEHVWGGGYEIITEGSYYARIVAEIERNGQVGYFPHDPSRPVYTAWDLGIDDYTAVWFLQVDDPTKLIVSEPCVTIIDYYEASNLGLDEILAEGLPEYHQGAESEKQAAFVEAGRTSEYNYKRHFLPHDIGVREIGAGGRTRVQSLVELGVKKGSMFRGVAQKSEDRVNAVRSLLPFCRFNQSKRVMLGLSRLRRYSRKQNDALGTYTTPLHDVNSHGADAFGEFAANCGIKAAKPETKLPERKVATNMTFNDLVKMGQIQSKKRVRV